MNQDRKKKKKELTFFGKYGIKLKEIKVFSRVFNNF